jgi:DNA polymerase elongation subunit (family B)
MIISKKRYAGNKFEFDFQKYKFTSMGLVTKRRDNAPILKNIYKGLLDIMFGEDETSIAIKKAIKLYQESVTDLLKGNVNIEDLIVTKTLKTGYKNPTAITHKVLAERITERDPGNAPSTNERIPFIFIDPKELKCYICKKKVNVDSCKCKQCMKLYCYTHLKQHKKDCIFKCRLCWTIDKVSICNCCNGCYCNKHKMGHKCSNISEKALQGDFAETPTYIQENNLLIDYRYYLDHQIRKPVSQIFELIKETKNVDPLKQILIKDNNRINKVKNITDFFK